MNVFQSFTSSVYGRVTVGIVLVVAVVLVGFQLRNLFGAGSAVARANDRIFICSETLKSFHQNLANLNGKPVPIYSPYSGKETGYPAELCYWTADGKVKDDPTPVLLNSAVGKLEPTFCPDCGRLVVGLNPRAGPNLRPAPTREEWERRMRR